MPANDTMTATAGMAWMPCTPSPWETSRLPSSPMCRPELKLMTMPTANDNHDRGDAVADSEPEYRSIGQHVGPEEAQPEDHEHDDVRQRGETEDDAEHYVHLSAFLGEARVEAAERLDRLEHEPIDGEDVVRPPPPTSPRWAEAGER